MTYDKLFKGELHKFFEDLYSEIVEKSGSNSYSEPNNVIKSIKEGKESTQIYYELPGINKSDIKLDLYNDRELRLNVTGTKFGSLFQYYDGIKLNNKADTENIESKYENGLLTITIKPLPKQPAKEVVIN